MTKQKGYKQAKTKDNQYFYWKVPTSIDSASKSQPTQQKPREKNDWENKLLKQANNDESVLLSISDSWKNGIVSEKQYNWFSKQLIDRNYK